MAGLIGVGTQELNQAIQGMGEEANLETQRNMADKSLNAQKSASNMNMMGSGAGLGLTFGPKIVGKIGSALHPAADGTSAGAMEPTGAAAGNPAGVGGTSYIAPNVPEATASEMTGEAPLGGVSALSPTVPTAMGAGADMVPVASAAPAAAAAGGEVAADAAAAGAAGSMAALGAAGAAAGGEAMAMVVPMFFGM
jgi:hypothetical protein